MTVPSSTSRVSYAGDGSTQVFPVPFYFLGDSHLVVTLRDSAGTEETQTLTTDYTVSGAGDQDGGSITMLSAPASGTTLVIRRVVPATQETDYVDNDSLPAETLEQSFDKLTMLHQQQDEELNRSVKVSVASPVSDVTLPNPSANKLIGWKSDETGLENKDSLAGEVVVSEFVEPALNTSNPADFFDAVGLSDGPVTFTDATEPVTLANIFGNTLSARWFGATFDGTADDAEAIQAALDVLKARGGGVVIIDGVVSKWDTGIVIPGGVCVRFTADCEVTFHGSGTAITFRDDSGTCYRASLRGKYRLIRSAEEWSAGTDTTSIGILMENCRYCYVDAAARYFNTGLLMLGKGDGCVHNIVAIDHLDNCRLGAELRDETVEAAIGWVTSNYVFGGRIGYSSSVVNTANGNAVAMRNITIAGVGFSNNNNTIIGVSFETLTPAADATAYSSGSVFVRVDGSRNRFINCRYESGGEEELVYYVQYGADSYANVVEGGRIPTDFFTKINDDSTTTTDPNRFEGFGRRGCRLRLTSDDSIPTAFTSVAWDQADYNTDGLWDVATPTAIIIPEHVRRIRVTVNMQYSTTETEARVLLRDIDASSVVGFNVRGNPYGLQAQSGVIGVTPGQRFRIETTCATNTATLSSGTAPGTWCEVEILN